MSALDTEYFRRKMELVIRDLSHYTPPEMARELVRLAKVADESETSEDEAQAAQAMPNPPSELLDALAETGAVIQDLGSSILAQATPEGAELPPLPKASRYIADDSEAYGTLEAAQRACDYHNECEQRLQTDKPELLDPDWEPAKPEPLFDADQMRKYARAALTAQQNSVSNSSNNSATTAAEPVPQYRPKRPDGSPWHDVPKGEYPCLPADLYEVRTLYRAAPPQQQEGEHK